MAWIEVIDQREATGELAEVYQAAAGRRGKLANILKVHSLNPQALRNHLDLYLTLMFAPSGLSREEREMVAVVVSATNNCDYCVQHHSQALLFYWKDGERVRSLALDYRELGLSPRHEAMLDYARKLTQAPIDVGPDDVERLREAGLSDRDILDLNLIVSYFNFVNRIALGLGVEFSDEEVRGYRY